MIEKLSPLKHIRKRPGMYIGNLRQEGISNLIIGICQELINNSTEEEGQIELNFDNNSFKIHYKGYSELEFLHHYYGKMNKREGAGFDKDVFFSFCAIPLSEKFSAEVQSKSIYSRQVFNRGQQVSYFSNEENSKERFIKFEFQLDHDIFEIKELDFFDFINRLYDLAVLNSDTAISFHQKDNHINFHFPEGIKNISNRWLQRVNNPDLQVSIKDKVAQFDLEIELFFSDHIFPQSNIKSYANKLVTEHHGSLVSGVLSGIMEAFDELKNQDNEAYPLEFNRILERINLVANVDGEGIEYCGNTKARIDVQSIEDVARQITYEIIKERLFKMTKKDRHEYIDKFREGWPWFNIEKWIKSVSKDK